MNNLTLPEKPTLKDYQSYVAEMVKARGFDKETVAELFMLFLEECGEMAKSARKNLAIKDHAGKEYENLQGEVADVFIYLLDICNHYDIDLEQAFRDKEAVNKQRTWK